MKHLKLKSSNYSKNKKPFCDKRYLLMLLPKVISYSQPCSVQILSSLSLVLLFGRVFVGSAEIQPKKVLI